ncbi:hypothetical protein [Streptomyces sp. SAI-144]|uniref:hypothetical protein n=1 Tax=Streptomyces sp. SAI-144 TaxID=2940544 RepID=UPI00247426B1|nr:hypothetical protein [Streptomyces sp. SAI-144]
MTLTADNRPGLPNPVARAADSALLLAVLTVTALAATAWTLTTRRTQSRTGRTCDDV